MNDYSLYYGMTMIAFVLTFGAQMYIQSTYRKYGQIANRNGVTGARAAAEILLRNNITDVGINKGAGVLTDHYDPRNSTVTLSQANYDNASIASVAVSSHECGHVLQDKTNYYFLRLRAAMYPIVSFSSYGGYLAIMVGVMFNILGLIQLGILMECVILAFQVITLPVEFDASNRALREIQKYGFLDNDELQGAQTVLRAAALTYVAGVASALLQILRLVVMFGGRRRRDD
ncbi:MAG: zinc metallopeptidase [Erysipelotrichaceae bacterium]|nr:zinc metallopeptidase [Erysipelotrichaceae bacterium]